MFIPNKTYNAIRVSVLAVIAALLITIAGQSVLYNVLEKETQIMIDSLEVKIDELAKATNSDYRNASGRQDGMDELLYEFTEKVRGQEQSILQLQEFTTRTQTSVDKLLRNECTPETAIYVLTRDMVAVCRSLGVTP